MDPLDTRSISLPRVRFSRCFFLLFHFACLFAKDVCAQSPLHLRDAIARGVQNYGLVKAKANYAAAGKALVKQAERDYLPNLNLGVQQDFGTINGQSGPLYGFGGLAAASSGAALSSQNWNAAFGAMYLTNINWDFFAFGRAKEKINTAKAAADRDQKDWEQEVFRHKVRVAGSYLSLLAAKQLRRSYERNLERTDTLRRIVVTKAVNGLVAGVDSSQANAEWAAARIALIKAIDFEQEQASQLAQLIDTTATEFLLDTSFLTNIPVDPSASVAEHPVLEWYRARVGLSEAQAKYFHTFYYPAFTLVSVLQTRGSGFGSAYGSNQSEFDKRYLQGIKPVRTNYLFGVGVTWNFTQPFRISQQVRAQHLISEGFRSEYELARQQVNAQLQLSDLKMQNAFASLRQVPIQMKAAQDAYLQKSVLYRNGLTTLVDVTQAAYALIRAETDRDIAYSNVWQALLLKAAAAGDFSLFESQL